VLPQKGTDGTDGTARRQKLFAVRERARARKVLRDLAYFLLGEALGVRCSAPPSGMLVEPTSVIEWR